MDIKKCRMCGKTYQSFGLAFCPRCMQEMDDKYRPVRDYLYDNPNASVDEVMEGTGVSEKIIMHYLREGRLRMISASGFLRCEQCNAPIETGKICDNCLHKLDSRIAKPLQARQAQQEAQRRAASQQPEGRRMYTYKDR